jgi:hypothetical protein
MSLIAPYVIIVGVFFTVVAGLWFVVLAFKRHIGWGLAVLFVPFANLVFLIRAWSRARRPFLLSIAGMILCGVGLFLSPERWANVRAFYAKIARLASSPAAAEAVVEKTDAEKLAELRMRERNLLARKAALRPLDVEAAQALALEIKAYNVELKAALAHATHATPRSPVDAFWKTDLTTTAIPPTPVAGRIAGETFSVDYAWLENGSLTLRHGTGLFPEHELVIVLAEPNPAGRSFAVTTLTGSASPEVHMKCAGNNRLAETQVFMNGYAMRLEFGQAADDQIGGAIYLCLPDPGKSYLAGTFRARVIETASRTTAGQ